MYPLLLNEIDEENGKLRFHRHIMFKTLMTREVDVNTINKNGSTVLHKAMRANVGYVRMLLRKNADYSIRDRYGNRPLYSAFVCENKDKISVPLEAGADIDIILGNGGTLLHEFARRNRMSIVRLLVQRGADPMVMNSEGLTAYDVAQSLPSTFLYKVIKKHADARMDMVLALMMSKHARLGENSHIQHLDKYLIEKWVVKHM